jgi:hypothetical protein
MKPRIVRIRARNQITLPADMLHGTPLHVGDYVSVNRLESGAIELTPIRLVAVGSTEAAAQEIRGAVRKRRRAKRERKVAAAAATS